MRYTPLKIVARAVLLSLFTLAAAPTVVAMPPETITYQGYLTQPSGGPVPDGGYDITFRIYDQESGGTLLWQTGPSIPVQVKSGLFTIQLSGLPQDIFLSSPRYLGIQVGGDPEMTPRTLLASSSYAIASRYSDTAYMAMNVYPGSVHDASISPTANIAPHKISGIAATLGASQTFLGSNTFSGNLSVRDTNLNVDQYGVTIGTWNLQDPTKLLAVFRGYDTPNERNGIYVAVDNDGSGKLTGVRSGAIANTAGGGGYAVGGDFIGSSDNDFRTGVYGVAQPFTSGYMLGTSMGLWGVAYRGEKAYGLYATAHDAVTTYGVYASAVGGTTNWAGYFNGDVYVTGTLTKGAGAFRIDHPLDPENKYLQHSFVESPDMMNMYNGNVTTDHNGTAVVTLPSYFEALNRDFRYQLTVIGQFAQAIVSKEVSSGEFTIRTDRPNVKVSWQVTGIRRDKYAEANPIETEIAKGQGERGKYVHPRAFGHDESSSIEWENDHRAAQLATPQTGAEK